MIMYCTSENIKLITETLNKVLPFNNYKLIINGWHEEEFKAHSAISVLLGEISEYIIKIPLKNTFRTKNIFLCPFDKYKGYLSKNIEDVSIVEISDDGRVIQIKNLNIYYKLERI